MSKEGLTAVLIDMQHGFLKSFDYEVVEGLILHQQKVIRLCAQEDIPLVVVSYRKFGETVKDLKKVAKNVPRFFSLIKRDDDAFLGTRFDEMLKNLETRNLVLMGIMSDACVKKTAKSAIDRGYQILTCRQTMDTRPSPPTWGHKIEFWYTLNGKYFQYTNGLLDHIREKL